MLVVVSGYYNTWLRWDGCRSFCFYAVLKLCRIGRFVPNVWVQGAVGPRTALCTVQLNWRRTRSVDTRETECISAKELYSIPLTLHPVCVVEHVGFGNVGSLLEIFLSRIHVLCVMKLKNCCSHSNTG
ncbi:hypothetical protein AMECASPLE_027214, partial [Ameca splendens]